MADINYDDLCNLIALEIGNRATPSSVKKCLKATYKVILKQLKLNNRIYFKNFGYFEIKQRKSGERLILDPNTKEKKLVYVKPKYSISFKPSSIFDKSVNENDFKIITEKGVQRLKKRKPKISNTVDLLNTALERSKKESTYGKE